MLYLSPSHVWTISRGVKSRVSSAPIIYLEAKSNDSYYSLNINYIRLVYGFPKFWE